MAEGSQTSTENIGNISSEDADMRQNPDTVVASKAQQVAKLNGAASSFRPSGTLNNGSRHEILSSTIENPDSGTGFRLSLDSDLESLNPPRLSGYIFQETPIPNSDEYVDLEPPSELAAKSTLPAEPKAMLGHKSFMFSPAQGSMHLGNSRKNLITQGKTAPTPALRSEPILGKYKPSKIAQHFANSNTSIRAGGQLSQEYDDVLLSLSNEQNRATISSSLEEVSEISSAPQVTLNGTIAQVAPPTLLNSAGRRNRWPADTPGHIQQLSTNRKC